MAQDPVTAALSRATSLAVLVTLMLKLHCHFCRCRADTDRAGAAVSTRGWAANSLGCMACKPSTTGDTHVLEVDGGAFQHACCCLSSVSVGIACELGPQQEGPSTQRINTHSRTCTHSTPTHSTPQVVHGSLTGAREVAGRCAAHLSFLLLLSHPCCGHDSGRWGWLHRQHTTSWVSDTAALITLLHIDSNILESTSTTQ